MFVCSLAAEATRQQGNKAIKRPRTGSQLGLAATETETSRSAHFEKMSRRSLKGIQGGRPAGGIQRDSEGDPNLFARGLNGCQGLAEVDWR